MNRRLGRLIEPNLGLFFVILFAFCIAALGLGHYWLGAAELAVTLLLLFLDQRRRARRKRELEAFVHSTANIPATGSGEIPFPAVLIRVADGTVLWSNSAFSSITGYHDRMQAQRIAELLPGVTADWLTAERRECPYDVTVAQRRYRVYGRLLRADDPAQSVLAVLYLCDLTELYQVRDEYVRSRPVVSIILVDNYDELTSNLTEGAISTLNAKLNDVITHWTEGYHGLLRRLERNRYLFIFEKRDLARAVNGKFSLLEDIHRVTNPAGVAASISFGLGVDGISFDESYSFAALSIEMALSRGGDQAVIKDRLHFNFYGGRTQEADHRSKVRSRVTAGSLMELIGQSSQVFIMGHRNADLDAVGAAMGVGCLCRKKGVRFHIVLDLEQNAAQPLLREIMQVPAYQQDCFISGQEALLLCDNRSTLVVVDTNRPDQVECKPLLEAISRVCVIDHHRRAADYISTAVVNFHEPFASSASELVTELLEYGVEKADVLPIESKSLLAGIFLDTKSFHVRTGERTFDAAAFLRRLGADPVEVKKLLQNDFQTTLSRYQIIRSARMYRQDIAIAALNSETSRTLAAQAADELLNISGISASFVLYPYEGQVIISARSIGEANVQMILEPLGGGGNAATAGAQIKDSTVKEALDRLVASIDKFYEA